jgi:hypothetical protein
VPDEETGVTPLSTTTGGKVDHAVDKETGISPKQLQDHPGSAEAPARPSSAEGDLVGHALASAQGISRRKRKRIKRENLLGRSAGGYAGPGPDARDPQPIGRLLTGYVDELGWQQPLAEARVFAEWASLVGADVAAHCTPTGLRAGELRIAAESTAWATQLRLLAGTVLARLVKELGPQVVTKLIITGPVAPSWKHGGWSVRGSRGPRDTYG